MRIGLTGGIAAGKSTVAARLRELGAFVIDYDRLARDVVAPGTAGLRRVAEAFGAHALTADGELNRTWLAVRVFTDRGGEDRRRRLNAIIHPMVYAAARQLENRCDGQCAVVVHDVPLLAEVIDAIPFAFAHIVTVEAPVEVRIVRMVKLRHMTRLQAVERIRHQPTRARREAVADVVIDSDLPPEAMLANVDRLYRGWLCEHRRAGLPAGPRSR